CNAWMSGDVGMKGSGGTVAAVELPGAADAEAEALFSHEGGAAVLDGGGVCGFGTMPVQRRGESHGVFRAVALEVVDGAGGDGEMGGFGTGFAVRIGIVGEGVAGHGKRFIDHGGDEGGLDALAGIGLL